MGHELDMGGWGDWLEGREPDGPVPKGGLCWRCGSLDIKEIDEGPGWNCRDCGLGWWWEGQDGTLVFDEGNWNKMWSVSFSEAGTALVVAYEEEL